MADRLGVELARVGHFDLSTGPLEVTPAMLSDAAQRDGGKLRAPVKLGHTDTRNDGEPAFGWVQNLRVEGAADDPVLKGDLTDLPDWLDKSANWAYPHRSIEGTVTKDADGNVKGFELTGLALLGATPPGMPTIESWRDLPQVLVAAAAAGSDMTVSEFVAIHAAAVPISGTVADPKAPAEPPVAPSTNPKEAVTVTDTLIAGLRERFGFPEDADESAILAAVDEARDPDVTPEAIAAKHGLTAEQVSAALTAAKTPTSPNTVEINKDQLDELRIAAAAGAEARAHQLRTERDQTISAAIAAGKVAPVRRDHWTKSWDADPEGTKASLDGLDAIFPVAASGTPGQEDTAEAAFTDETAEKFAAMLGTTKEALSG